jgi:acyl-CoA hydrolase
MLFNEYGDSWLISGSIDIKFKSPIYMDETIATYGEVVTSENNIIKLNVSITKNDGTEAIKGYATIKF